MVGRLPYPTPSSPSATVTMKANRRVDTVPEVLLRSELHRCGLRFRKDMPVRVADGVVRPDIVFPRRRLAVFVDGCFWHACPQHGSSPRANSDYWGPKLKRNVERDARTDTRLREAGWRVLRIWEHVPLGEASELVVRCLGG